MIDVIKKTLLAGVGAAVITKDKVESALNEFVQQGKVSSTEARTMAEKIADQGRREFDAMSHELSEKLRERFTGYDRMAQQRIDFLEARVAALEKAAGLIPEPGTTAAVAQPMPASPPIPSPGA
jgi:polyhydroxyalkanoate synthesis regulator phasin